MRFPCLEVSCAWSKAGGDYAEGHRQLISPSRALTLDKAALSFLGSRNSILPASVIMTQGQGPWKAPRYSF